MSKLTAAYLGATCGAQSGAPALFTGCAIRDRTCIFYRISRPLPAGQGQLVLTPLSSDLAAVAAALSAGREPPRRGGTAGFRLNLPTTAALSPGTTLTINFDSRLCGADVWLVRLTDGSGTVHPHSGIQLSPCGPREGSFAGLDPTPSR